MSDGTDFLYPMIDGTGGGETQTTALLEDLAASATEKTAISTDLTASTLQRWDGELDAIARAMTDRVERSGRLFTFGNGGSSTDAEGVAALFTHPPDGSRSLPARSLVNDVSILTALSNDIGFDVVFARQLIAHATEPDIAMGFSTSGNSENVIKAFEEAAEHGLLTVGFAGSDGGAMAHCDALQHCVIVNSQSVHRIQEAQSATAHDLWRRIQGRLDGRADAPRRST